MERLSKSDRLLKAMSHCLKERARANLGVAEETFGIASLESPTKIQRVFPIKPGILDYINGRDL